MTYHYDSMILLNQLRNYGESKESNLEFTQEFVDKYLSERNKETKYEIYEEFQKSYSASNNINFLKNLYGIGGITDILKGSGIGIEFDAKGIKFYRDYSGPSAKQQLFKWNYIEKRIKSLIHENKYLTPEELEEYPIWLEKEKQERDYIEESESFSENNNLELTEEKNEYRYKVGDKVYIGLDEYEISKIGLFDIELYNPSTPLFGRTMNIVEFENKLKENPANDYLKIDYQKNGLDFETITPIKDLTDNESYTVARIINDNNCVELHYNKGNVYVELGTKNNDNSWENEIKKVEWFSKNLTDKQVLDKLEEIFNNNFGTISNENYYGEYNDEIDLVEHILKIHKIDDMQVAFNSNENISIWNDDDTWEGKEIFDFILDELLDYNEDGTAKLVDNNDLKRLQEYQKKYKDKEQEIENLLGKKVVIDNIEYSIDDIGGNIATLRDNSFQQDGGIPKWKDVPLGKVKELVQKQESTKQEEIKIVPTEKEKTNYQQSQLSLFAPREQELADRILEEFNSFDTKYKDTFYIDNIELENGNEKSKKRNLIIEIKSKICTGFDETSFTQFNSDKTDENVLRESVDTNIFLKYLNQDNDFSIVITPNNIMIFWNNFDKKQFDLSIGKDNILSSINNINNIEIIDNPEQPKIPSVKNHKNKVINYVLHPEIPYEKRINYKITDNNLGNGLPRERFNNNINAIKVLKKLDQENRYATPEEQEILSKYVGWGGLAKSFEKNSDWQKEYEELGNLIGFDTVEYEKAKNSVNTAFYTPPIIIKAIYKALENMGLEKGNILEPSCGIGNFIGLLPNNDKLKIYGIEIDEISGKIARQLYQKSSIAIEGFENTNYPNSFFDVAIGNVPFGDFQVYDKKYDKYHFLIHDYFFAKTIDKVRPGGIIAFITSQGTLDKKSEDVRKYIAQRANFLGAIRLPNNVFKDAAGTDITSDIIFLQKRDSITDIIPDWVHLDNSENGIVMNKYFVDNPDMILGKMEMVSKRFGNSPECLPYENKNLEELLNNAIKNIHAEITDYQLEELTEEDRSIEADLNVKNFSYTIINDKVYYRENSRMYPQDLAITAENRVKGLIELRDTTRELINMQLENYSDEKIAKQQEKLNNIYDNFTKKYGLINSRANASVFSDDNSYYLLCSLEILDENGNLARKADMFSKRTIMAKKEIKKIETATDALIACIGEKAFVDINYMQKLCNMDMDKMLKDLEGIIFNVPEYGNPNHWVTADEYLSGNVREKLKIAEEFAQNDEKFNINVKYLKNVQPKDLSASEISVRLGSTWIPLDIYEDFMKELFKPGYDESRKVKIFYNDINNEWLIVNKGYGRYNEKVNITYGTKRISGYKILEDSLNLRDVKIYDYICDNEGHKKRILNGKETAIAQGKQEQIKQAFQDWIWSEPNRRNRLEKKYNELFNSIKPREFDGSKIIFDGMNPEISLRPHQLNAIARILYGGNTLLAHEVGAGKTFEMVAAAMESKRLGLCNKSLFAVPNHIVEQFASEFLQLYPSANILVATKKDFETAYRKKFCSRIATGDYDAIIIGHSQFEKIPMSIERQKTLLEKEINDIVNSINDCKEDGTNFTVKQLMKTKKNIETKLKKLNDSSNKDNNVVTFEQLGIDRLFVDEAHNYKNLYLYTKMGNVSGIQQTEAQKSSDLFMKCKYLDEITHNKGIIFATGTPVSNSMTELYTMQRYLQTDTLNKLGLQNFDGWASTFGETTTAIELAPEGTGYRAKTRFAKFYNLPELMAVFKEVADIKTADVLNLPVPQAHYENIVVQPSEIQEEMVKGLAERAEKIRNGGVDPHDDNMLKITNDGKKLALDQRLINELLPDYENSKVNVCVNNIYKFYKDYDNVKATQLVFCDLSTPKNDGTFSVYNDLKEKLITKGIPSEEIAFIHDVNNEIQKKELFSKVRKGLVRVLIGSTQKMGAGTNCQDRLIAIHDLDCPWRPADLQQRAGRIVRQGNQNKDVYIFRYVTEKTFDAYLYQLIENKQKFISQIMTSKTPLRTASDVDETVLSYAEIKALAAGNPLILEKTELDAKVAKLKLLKQNYLSQKYELEDKIRNQYPQDIKYAEDIIKEIENDIITLNKNKTEDFNYIILNGITYNDKKEAGNALLNIMKNNSSIENEINIGNYLGFDLFLKFSQFQGQYILKVQNNNFYYVTLGSDSVGNITRIDNQLNKLPDFLLSRKKELEILNQQLENAKEEMNKPFSQEQELNEAITRLKKVDSKLKINEKVPEILDTLEDNLKGQVYKEEFER